MSKSDNLGVRSPVFYKNYDYTTKDEKMGPGGGLYHGRMDRFKSVKDFINKSRKRFKKKQKKNPDLVAQEVNRLYKFAIFNEFWTSESDILPSTQGLADSVDNTIANFFRNTQVPSVDDNEITNYVIDLLEDLFEKIVYYPSHQSKMNVNDDRYRDKNHLTSTDWEFVIHDMIHEALDPDITQEFEELEAGNFDEEGNPIYNLRNFMSEHQAQFVGADADTSYLAYGLETFIDTNLEQKTRELMRLNLTPKEQKEQILSFIVQEINNVKPSLQPTVKYLLLEPAKNLLRKDNFEILGFFKDLNKDVKRRFGKRKIPEQQQEQPWGTDRRERVGPNLLSDSEQAIANRVRLYFKYMNKYISSGRLDKHLTDLYEQK